MSTTQGASQNDKQQQTMIIVAAIVIGVIAYAAINVGIFLTARNSAKKTGVTKEIGETIPSITSTPTPRPLTSKGVYDFTVSAGGGKLSLITAGKLNPVDPPIGGKQDLEVTTVAGAEGVNIVLTTDTKEKKLSLTKDAQNPNVWRGSWSLDDNYSYVYTLKVLGTVNGNPLEVPIMFR